MAADIRHFLDLADLSPEQARAIIDHSAEMKRQRLGRTKGAGDDVTPLSGHILALIFEKPSTRTRVSFDVAMRQLGGETIVLSAADLQLGRGESEADTGRVLSRYVDAIMIRGNSHARVEKLAAAASIPVINGLTDFSHPCQIMADVMTFEEHRGSIAGKTIAWLGDGNNVAVSWVHAAAKFGFEIKLGCPSDLNLRPEVIEWARRENVSFSLHENPDDAVRGADCVVADTWVSMGDEDTEMRKKILQPYQVNQALMDNAKAEAIFMHCLPAYRGDEVTAEVIDGPQSVVFDEAENRLHAQKGILAWCLAHGAS